MPSRSSWSNRCPRRAPSSDAVAHAQRIALARQVGAVEPVQRAFKEAFADLEAAFGQEGSPISTRDFAA
jgi:hypothetical protein